MFSSEHLYSIALRRCANVGDVIFKRLVQAEGSAESVWKLSKKSLTSIFGIGSRTAAEIGDATHLKFAEKELHFCEKNNVSILLRHHKELPFLLDDCEDAPAILYKKGNIEEALKPISIVGTRNATAYGKLFVKDFLSAFPADTAITVSGMALGVDTEVHEHSLENNIPTIAVLAHGLHTIYPSKNRKLSESIIEKGGALLTEFTTSHKPDRENFIQRNRIVAGMSHATIVVETAFGGGSISTATFANNYNRDVYALPGRIVDKYSQGCNHLVHSHKAAAISSIPTLIEALSLGGAMGQMPELFPKSETRPALSEYQQKIYEAIQQEPNINLDDLSHVVSIPAFRLLPVLLELEISGYLKSFSGRQFVAL